MAQPLIATRYVPLERIGQGGVAIVYRARDERLGRVVALKILREHLASDPEFQERFQREARIAASLAHPNIVGVHDYGAHGDAAFIAMDYVDGQTLKERIRQVGRLPVDEAVRIERAILSALGYAHARGVVHRDVKPQNVMVDRDGQIKLTDFGIARATEESGLTQTGTTVGSAVYMAPEQARGDRVGPAADVYGAGLVLYEMLVGRPPFEGAALVQVMYRQLNEQPALPSTLGVEIPPPLEAALMRALAKDPAERFASAEEMSGALAAALASPSDRSPAPTALWPDRSTTSTALAISPDRSTTSAAPWPDADHTASAPPVAAPPARERGLPLASVVGALAALALVVAGLSYLSGLGPDEVLGATVARPVQSGTPAGSPSPSLADGAAASPAGAAAGSAAAPSPTAAAPAAAAPTAAPSPLAPSPTPAPPTPTAAPPTATAPASTATAQPPTATAAPATATAQPPSATPPAPTAIRAESAPAASGSVVLEDTAFAGGYRNAGASVYRQRSATWVYGAGTEYSTMTASFEVAGQPGAASLVVTGLTSENWRPLIAVLVNDREVFRGASPFPQDPGAAGKPNVFEGAAPWGDRAFPIPPGVLRAGTNTLTIRNLEGTSTINQPPWTMVDRATIRLGG